MPTVATTDVTPENIDYSKHIGLDTFVRILPQQNTEEYILAELKNISSYLKLPNYTVVYEFDTSVTTKQTKDIYAENNTYASALYIDAEGGGFDLNINDSTFTILGIKGTRVYDEVISKISVTGHGNTGKGLIRLNLLR